MALDLAGNEKIVVIGATGNIAIGLYQNPIFLEALANSQVAALISSSHVSYNPELAVQVARSGDKNQNKLLLSEKGEKYDHLEDVQAYLEEERIRQVVIDVSNGNLIDYHINLADGDKLVTANKIPLATSSFNQFNFMVGPRYGAEATVMAGRGIYGDVERAAETGNKIKSIEGVFSGTMGFIMSELEAGKKLSEAIRAAIEGGYTEPNPMDDLDGLDVAKKLVILARGSGHDVSLEDVEVRGLLDDSYRRFFPTGWDKKGETESEIAKNKQEAIEEFLSAVAENEDDKYRGPSTDDDLKHSVLRFIASFKDEDGQVTMKVGKESRLKDSQIGQLSGTENIAVLGTEKYQKVITGPGAGIPETAAGVMENLYSVLAAR